MPKKHPGGRPRTSGDGELRTVKVRVCFTEPEATTLDTLRGPKSRAAHLRERGLMPVVEPAKEPK